jgi:hypothetical protein
MLGQPGAHYRGPREVQSDCVRSTVSPPKSRNSTFFLRVLVAYGALVGALHWTISWYVSSHARVDARPPPQARPFPALSRDSRHAGDAQRVLHDHFACIDRLALYYAPPLTQPRLEDFEFLMHAMRVWKATRFTASMVVLIDPANASHRPLARACRTLPRCHELIAPAGPVNNQTLMHFVQAVLKDLSARPAEKSYECGVPEAGVLVYAPRESDASAILDSRAIFGNAHARNTTTCIDKRGLLRPHTCMAFAWH